MGGQLFNPTDQWFNDTSVNKTPIRNERLEINWNGGPPFTIDTRIVFGNGFTAFDSTTRIFQSAVLKLKSTTSFPPGTMDMRITSPSRTDTSSVTFGLGDIALDISSAVGWRLANNKEAFTIELNAVSTPEGPYPTQTILASSRTTTPGYYGPYIEVTFADNLPPSASPATPADNSYTNSLNVPFHWNYSDPEGNAQGAFLVQIATDLAFTTNVFDSGWQSSSATTYTWNNLSDATWRWRVKVRDSFGAESGWSSIFTVITDTVPPTIGSVDGHTYHTTASGTVTKTAYNVADNSSTVSRGDAYWRINGGAWSGPFTATKSGSNFSYGFPLTAGNGLYDVQFWVYDPAGNGTSISTTYRVDTVAPAGNGGIDGHSYHNTASGTVRKHTYDWRDSGSGVRTYADAYWNLNGGAWNGPFTAPSWDNGSVGTEFYYDFPLTQGQGTYTVRFWVYDLAGNGSFQDTSYTLDSVAPNVPSPQTATNVKTTSVTLNWAAFFDSAPSSGYARTRISFTKTGGGAFVDIDGAGGIEEYIEVSDNRRSHTVNGLTPGTQYFWAIQNVDVCGNYGAASFAPVTTNTLAVTITSPTENQYLATRTPTVQWTYAGSLPQAAFYIEMVANGNVLWTSGWISSAATSYTLPSGAITADGAYYFRMMVQDTAGSQSAMSTNVNFASDITPPTIGAGPAYVYTNQAAGAYRAQITVSDNSSGLGAQQDANFSRPGASGTTPTTVSGGTAFADISLGPDGEYTVDFFIRDRAGNQASPWPKRVQWFKDTGVPLTPTLTLSYDAASASASASWTAMNDAAPSSGLLKVELFLELWNGSAWASAETVQWATPQLSYTLAGLTRGGRYRCAVRYTDQAGNGGALVWTEFMAAVQIGAFKVSGSAGTVYVLPIYNPGAAAGSAALRIQTSSGLGCFSLVLTTDPKASPLHLSTTQGIRAIMKL